MSLGPVIEIASLAQRHPKAGKAMLRAWAPALRIRLCDDPKLLEKSETQRSVTVSRCPPPGEAAPYSEECVVGWGTMELTDDERRQIRICTPDHELTEKAALGMFGLLGSYLEGIEVLNVLRLGSGGDYRVVYRGGSTTQAEVSGIKMAAYESQASTRLSEKSAQVTKRSADGFVSVTTFQHPGCDGVHSYLHYVKKVKKSRNRRGRR